MLFEDVPTKIALRSLPTRRDLCKVRYSIVRAAILWPASPINGSGRAQLFLASNWLVNNKKENTIETEFLRKLKKSGPARALDL